MNKTIISIFIFATFFAPAECAKNTKPIMKKQETRIRCQPGYMFERGKCIIIPEMENSSIRH